MITKPSFPEYRLALSISVLSACSFVQAWEPNLGTNLPPVDIHGFVSQGFLHSSDYNYLGDTRNGSFEFFEVGLNASFNPFPRTRIAVQGFAFDIGQVGNYEPLLDYALLEYTFNDKIGFRGGRIRRPQGIYNHIVDVDVARTWVLLPQGVYDARWRDFYASTDGGEVFGNLPLGKAGSLSYGGYIGLARPTSDGGLGRWIVSLLPPGSTFDDVNSPLTVGEQLWWDTPLEGLRAGVAYQRVFDFESAATLNLPPPPFGPGPIQSKSQIDVNVAQVSLEYIWKAWKFETEYSRLWTSPQDAELDAWYVSAAYRFNNWFEAGTYYTEYYSDVNDRDGSNLAVSSDGFQKDVALSLRFDPADHWTFKLEGHYIRGTALIRENAVNPARNDEGWWMLAAKATFSF